MNVLHASNSKKGPHKAFNAYKEFSDKELDAQIVAATMEYFEMKEFEGKNYFKVKYLLCMPIVIYP